MNDSSIRTRFAPSPTGYLHVGGARTALFNWLYARKHGGSFVLRVEDTDEERNTDEARQAIFDGMSWLGLDWDEGPQANGQTTGEFGPYFQSQRKALYDKWFEKLQADDRVYEDDGAWRFRFERKPVTMQDLICGEVTIDYTNVDNTPDMVIRRSDGSYVFHFVNVVDDLEMKISHVIRGEDHLMNTPKHLQLFEAFGVEPPQYGHIPLILNSDGSKMSKRDTGAAVGSYNEDGYLPEAVFNFLSLLGWSPKDESEVMTVAEIIERFSLEAIVRSPAKFDVEKCAWINQQHLMQLSPDAFASDAAPFVEKAGFTLPENYSQIAASVQEKVRLLTEVPSAIAFFLDPAYAYDTDALNKVRNNEAAAGLLGQLADSLGSLDDWTEAKACIGATAKANGAKPGQLMFPTRIALSGQGGGPDLGDILNILGKEESIRRIQRTVQELSQG
ncbi:glutamate--tRNA ligase [Verrucomicrobiaceae bacterium N1E253]|uniref:Glutamate--tRNA ligase n=1 Tax=Oceaniferula marina TaxID=2748318 RepID=A0A851GBS9_9BACT|nr:glutamate--tRNA ligase [Oceaniferula marina]NWK55198.1 glutamate--tRNA ligase [Oceaniferula marina]